LGGSFFTHAINDPTIVVPEKVVTVHKKRVSEIFDCCKIARKSFATLKNWGIYAGKTT